ncbi:LacI family transcriptional regulator [Vibrio breoganii]|nr:LacI family transcriptional regulator [Vibrio breoganii]PMK73053.1 LacI family transcriptional regulator [Vibrio breoganii]PML20679.1 LacI family transcriptional regulator [Vibrio breoganii]PML54307.1 LacI family transcriptional regulator [Vibrio breoganii]PMM02483.1 LacI family transcriptional regulator [Vibrio breoganii]
MIIFVVLTQSGNKVEEITVSVTFKDVAKLAGVSTQTVSRVTNGSENVAEKTRNKVNKAIKQLGYVPNKGAQMLSRARSTSIGLITLDMALHGAALIANGVRMKAHELHFGTAFSVVSDPTLSNIQQSIRELIAQQVECVILNVPLTSEDATHLVEQFQSLHLIFIDVPDGTGVHFVHGEHADGAAQSVQHLLEGNREQFVLITGPSKSSASKIRLESWLSALRDVNKSAVFQYQGDWQAQSGYLAVREAIAKQKSFDAILVASDQMALGALRALNEMNIEVPQQVAVVGFDGIADSAYFNPPLTTVKQDFTEIGQQAVILAIELKNHDPLIEPPQKQVRIPVELIKRESSKPKIEAHYQKQQIQDLLRQVEALLPDQ